jgi:hypothetical protein
LFFVVDVDARGSRQRGVGGDGKGGKRDMEVGKGGDEHE